MKVVFPRILGPLECYFGVFPGEVVDSPIHLPPCWISASDASHLDQRVGAVHPFQWRGVNCDISNVMPFKPMEEDRITGCSQQTS